MANPTKGILFVLCLMAVPACEQVLGMGGEYGDLPADSGDSDTGDSDTGDASKEAGSTELCDPADPELAACYPFDDTTDLGHDSSGYGNHATASRVDAAAGVSGTAVELRTGSYMKVENSPSLEVDHLTIELWIRPSNLPFYRAGLFDKDGQYGFFLHKGGELRCSAAGAALSSSVTIEVGTWTHVACTYDGAELALYVNGSQVDSTPASGPISSVGTTGASIGSDSPWGDSFEGELDELRVWRYARSKQDICRAAGGTDGSCGGI